MRFGKITAVTAVDKLVTVDVEVSGATEQDVVLWAFRGVSYDLDNLEGSKCVIFPLDESHAEFAAIPAGAYDATATPKRVALHEDTEQIVDAIKNSATGGADGGATYKANMTAALGGLSSSMVGAKLLEVIPDE